MGEAPMWPCAGRLGRSEDGAGPWQSPDGEEIGESAREWGINPRAGRDGGVAAKAELQGAMVKGKARQCLRTLCVFEGKAPNR